MAIVASFFDTDSAATNALDEFMHKPEFKDDRTQVITTRSDLGDQPGGLVSAVQPQSPLGVPNNDISPVPVTGEYASSSLFDEVHGEERDFFRDALRRGGVLVLAKVADDRAGEAHRLFSMHGGRTYTEK